MGNVIKEFINGQTPSRNHPEYWKGDIPWVSSGELNYTTIINTLEKITEEGKNSANLKILPKGTFLIAITGLEAPGTRGSCGVLGIEATTNQSCMALIPKKEELSVDFLIQWYLKVGEEYGIKYTQGTKQQSYNIDLLKKLPIFLPKNIEEQEKISSFLSTIDKKIELLEKKQNYLLNFKKGFLNKIFIVQKADSWKEYKIGELGIFKSGYAFKNKYQGYLNYPIPFFKVSDMNLNLKYMEKSQNTINEEMCSEMKCKILEKPSIILAKLGEAIYLERKRIAEKPCVIDNNLLAFQPNDDFDLEFIYYMFLNYNLSQFAQQTAVPSLSPKDIGDIKCFVPNSIVEQKKISKIFLTLDKKIELIDNSLLEIKDFKKGLLQKMFV